MERRWVFVAAIWFTGCTQAPNAQLDSHPPQPISTDFSRLRAALEGIEPSSEVALYEGLPSEFWEPQLRESEASRKETVRLHDYPFYAERRVLSEADAERFTALLSDEGSFQRHRATKVCGGFNPDYGIEWKSGDAVTRILISLECGEVKIFGPRAELHCDLGPAPGKKLAQWLDPYRKNRPAPESGG